MSEFEQQLLERGFIVSKKLLFLNDKGLYIDLENKKWVVTGSSLSKLRRFDFAQIIDCSLTINKTGEVSGKSGGALVGGLIGGAAGAVIGGAGKRSVIEHVSSVLVKITVNDIKNPLITFYAGTDELQAEKMVALFAWMKDNT